MSVYENLIFCSHQSLGCSDVSLVNGEECAFPHGPPLRPSSPPHALQMLPRQVILGKTLELHLVSGSSLAPCSGGRSRTPSGFEATPAFRSYCRIMTVNTGER